MANCQFDKLQDHDLELSDDWTEHQALIAMEVLYDTFDESLSRIAIDHGLSPHVLFRFVRDLYYDNALQPSTMDHDTFQGELSCIMQEAMDCAKEAAAEAGEQYRKSHEKRWHRDYHREICGGNEDLCFVCQPN